MVGQVAQGKTGSDQEKSLICCLEAELTVASAAERDCKIYPEGAASRHAASGKSLQQD